MIVRSKKLRDSARGRDCTIRIPGYCNHDPSTTVLAHGNGGGGMKTDDTWAAFSCDVCHSIVDFRYPIREFTRTEIIYMHTDGIKETQHIWYEEGVLKV